jgi:hypothetical protein
MQARKSGGQGQNRTADTVIFSHVLYQLSYLAIVGGRRTASIAKLRSVDPPSRALNVTARVITA